MVPDKQTTLVVKLLSQLKKNIIREYYLSWSSDHGNLVASLWCCWSGGDSSGLIGQSTKTMLGRNSDGHWSRDDGGCQGDGVRHGDDNIAGGCLGSRGCWLLVHDHVLGLRHSWQLRHHHPRLLASNLLGRDGAVGQRHHGVEHTGT